MARTLTLTILFFFFTLTARAETVTLVSGSATRLLSDVSISVQGAPGFTLSYAGELSPLTGPTDFTFDTIRAGGGFTTFMGISTNSFRGGGSFNQSVIAFQIIAYAAGDTFQTGPVVFSTSAFGTGSLITVMQGGITTRHFIVGTPIPEPAGVVLLGLGLIGIVGAIQRRHK